MTSTSSVKVRQAENTTIRASDEKTVGLDYNRKASNINLEASSSISNKAANTFSVTASDVSTTASHISVETVQGFRPEKDGVAVPGFFAAKSVNVVNGNFELSVGNPLSGGVPLTNSSVKATTYVGDIYLSSEISGSIVLSSLAPSSLGNAGPAGIILNSPQILLGGIGSSLVPYSGPGMAACKFEALLAYVQALHSALDSHIHPTSVGPSGPPAAPFTPILTPFVAPIASSMVRIVL